MRFIALILLVFVATPAWADAAMTDAQLASYISGRLDQALAGGTRAPSVVCDDNGCAVVVQ